MRSRTLFLLILILAGLAVAVTVLVYREARQGAGVTLGQPLLRDLAVNKISLVSIRGPRGRAVDLKKGEKYWEVVQRYGYPADFSKITSLVRKISEMKVGNSFDATPEVSSRLGLVSPTDLNSKAEDQGILITLKDTENNELAGIIIGKTHGHGGGTAAMGGQYVRLAKGDTVYLVDKNFGYIEKDPKGWLDKELIKIQPDEIKKIYAVNSSGRLIYSFERKDKGKKLLPVGPLKDKKLNNSEVRRLERGISFLSLLDVANPKIKPTSLGVYDTPYVVYELFNGIRYRIFPGKSRRNGEDEYHIKINVDYHRPSPAKHADLSNDKEKVHKEQNKPVPAEMKLKAQQLAQRLSPWVFVVSRWNAGAFITDPEKLIEEKSEKNSSPKGAGGNKKKS